jgi:hypothetical protein
MRNNQKISIPISTPTTNVTPEKPVTSTSISVVSQFTEATIILALLTFIGYWGAFSYETAYSEYFRIPHYFISLNPTLVLFTSIMWTILGVVVACILIGIVVWIALKPVGKDIERRYPRIVKICSISFTILMLTLWVFRIITDQETRQILTVKNLLISAAIGVSWLFLEWLYERYKEDKEETPWGFIGVALLVSGFLFGLYLEFWFLRILGREMAQGQKVFHVYALPSSTSEVAVIRNYGDYLYAVPFNRITHEFETKLLTFPICDVSEYSWAFPANTT